MKILELFAGERCISRAFERRGHETFSVEWDRKHNGCSAYKDVNDVTQEFILHNFGRPDVIWMSPDCTTFSVAAISHHRKLNKETGNLDPISEYARFCDRTDQHCLELIKKLSPAIYFIENPRGALRKMSWMQAYPRYTVTYCKYGDTRMKPTDIWTNHPLPGFIPPCRNGDPCHEKAPRGSKSGTQGRKGKVERSLIPDLLCDHIVRISEEFIKTIGENK